MTCSWTSKDPGPLPSVNRKKSSPTPTFAPFSRRAHFMAAVEMLEHPLTLEMMADVRSCVQAKRTSLTSNASTLLLARSRRSVLVFGWTMLQLVQCSVPLAPMELEYLAATGKSNSPMYGKTCTRTSCLMTASYTTTLSFSVISSLPQWSSRLGRRLLQEEGKSKAARTASCSPE